MNSRRGAPAAGLAALLLAPLCGCPSEASEDGEAGAETGSEEEGSGDTGAGTGTQTGEEEVGTSSTDTGGQDETEDSGETEDSAETTGGDGLVSVFVAQGKFGRSTMSCDDGQTWIHERAYDSEGASEACDAVQSVVCFDGPCSFWDVDDAACEMQDSCDCDHSPGASTGLAAGQGVFAAAWGWGPKGALKYSADGASWAVGYPDTTQAGIAFGNGTFIAGSRTPRVSADGITWVDGGEADFRNENDEVIWNARTMGFAEVGGGVFVAGASSGENTDLMISSDDGQSWTRPTNSWACGGSFAGVAGGNGAIVVVFGDKACRSVDEGASFELVDFAGGADVVFDGEQFMSWGAGQRWISVDGASWTGTALEISGLPEGHNFSLGPVARSEETGTHVSVRSGWKVWYAAQDFYRSEDGLSWEVLPSESFVGSHPITHIEYGRLAQEACE
ncbi:hypothetical protein G6O69_05725 [Pseudenhygromyxa sp. WMMC2535]|uniref:hypothetical protein n=1 Tax=Pseudenhygromyxa sp. WMMC2535 TaxID=2712867 RepID=UPI001556D45D|nr:hypothetical protein [Pseudenhygromyxa sp. WMMC2535]NVB37321.1 hypothetical protein [Pseudenhygromyxa sp. WMMC2535]